MTFEATFSLISRRVYLIEQKRTEFQSNSIELNRFLNSIDFGNRINRTRSSSYEFDYRTDSIYDDGQPVNSVHLVIKVEWPVSTMLSVSLINLLVDLEVGTFFVKKKKGGRERKLWNKNGMLCTLSSWKSVGSFRGRRSQPSETLQQTDL